MSSSPYPDSILVAWASAYLAAGGNQTKARDSVISQGGPWKDILGTKGTKYTTWQPKASRLTAACRDAGALPRTVTRKTVHDEKHAHELAVTSGEVLLPGVIRDCMKATEVLSRLTVIASGQHPKHDGLTPHQQVRVELDALAQLVKVLGIEPPPKALEDSTDVQRARLRQRLAKLPADVLAQVREAFGDEEGV